jgi:hypothetical protein
MNIKDRYKYYPQMQYYDDLALESSPYLMFKSQNNYCSDVVNTDSNGFRLSGIDGKLQIDDLDRTGSVNIFTGGSSAFGVGATSDKSTISAYLSKATNSRWVNLSGRANVSTQEFISFAYYRDLLSSIDNIVIFSGVNDLYLYYASKYFNEQVGTFFNSNDWMNKMNRNFSLKSIITRPLINKILNVIYGTHNFNLISDQNAVKLLFRKISLKQIESILSGYGLIGKHNENPIEVLDVLKRNISNWKIMADSYNAKITYVLQPYSNWLPNRALTDNEKSVFEILDNVGGENWRIPSERINGLHSWYSQELSKVCEECNINYYDSNSILNKDSNEDIFVDRIHLTDNGNKLLSDVILEKLWN